MDAYTYHLPPEAIAQEPLADRSASRLMIVRPGSATFEHSTVRELATWLHPGDLVVANNSRVIPARMHAIREGSGGRVQLLLLHQNAEGHWVALAKPARRLRRGTRLIVPPRRGDGGPVLAVSVEDVGEGGLVTVALESPPGTDLATFGEVPLPPYIERKLLDEERYQTVYAQAEGSAAAPTAGLHITSDVIDSLRARGISWAEVTLHVGLDTFRPVSEPHIEDHPIHTEWCHVPRETAAAVRRTRERGGRVIAIGTTVARTLEFYGRQSWSKEAGELSGMADLFIVPGHRWQLVDGLLTNFHLPRSTLLLLVSALGGGETIRAAYATAIATGYRFYSFGDAMLIMPAEE